MVYCGAEDNSIWGLTLLGSPSNRTIAASIRPGCSSRNLATARRARKPCGFSTYPDVTALAVASSWVKLQLSSNVRETWLASDGGLASNLSFGTSFGQFSTNQPPPAILRFFGLGLCTET